MKVLVVEPYYEPYEAEIEGLRQMQDTVGGLITAIYPFEDQVAVVGNDESLLLDMPFNRSMEGGYGGIFGPFFVCGITEDNFCSLTPEQMETYKKKFHHAEILMGVKENDLITMKVPPAQKEKPGGQQRTTRPPER